MYATDKQTDRMNKCLRRLKGIFLRKDKIYNGYIYTFLVPLFATVTNSPLKYLMIWFGVTK